MIFVISLALSLLLPDVDFPKREQEKNVVMENIGLLP